MKPSYKAGDKVWVKCPYVFEFTPSIVVGSPRYDFDNRMWRIPVVDEIYKGPYEGAPEESTAIGFDWAFEKEVLFRPLGRRDYTRPKTSKD